MTDKQYKVTFQPQGRTCSVLEGTKLMEAAAIAGLSLNMPCGGAGTCGKCKVIIHSGGGEPLECDKNAFNEEELEKGWRFGCQVKINSDMVVQIPETSTLTGKSQILTESELDDNPEVIPSVYKRYLELDKPTLEDGRSDLERISNSLGKCKIDLHLIRNLPQLLREADFKVTAVMTDHTLIAIETGDTTDHCYGAAFDIGTTTVVGSLLDLATGSELAIVSRMNPQVTFGDDVLSRINHCSTGKDNLQEIYETIQNCISEMIKELCQKAEIESSNIYEVCIAGNTTMEHIFCKINPKQLGEVPFVSAFSRGLMFDANKLDLPISHNGKIYLLPVIGGFVGGDTVACILSSQIDNENIPCLMVDIGTNGEIVLAHNGKLWAASTAAGPALEGARIEYGMRAASGAIEKVLFNDEIHCSIIGDSMPIGICGSGIIDLTAELLKSGIMNPMGQLCQPEEAPEELTSQIAKRITSVNGQSRFKVADGANNTNIEITQKDVRELQLAVGAIRAGIEIMLNKAGLKASDLGSVMVAGGFGCYIRRDSAQRIGLLPTDMDREKINFIGNASLAGAKLTLLSSVARKHCEELARKTEHIELSLDMNFQMAFAEAMIFPSE